VYSFEDIQRCFNGELLCIGDKTLVRFDNAKPLQDANIYSICWIKDGAELETIITKSPAKTFIISRNGEIQDFPDKVIIRVDNPRLRFLQLVKALFIKPIEYAIHPTAIIHPEAQLSSTVYIGPHCVIGKCILGEHVIIQGNCYIYDDVTIGNHVNVMPNTTIGGNGFGYERNEDKEFELFPHIGGVIIEDHVDIGANTCIDRGTLGSTIIRSGTKIDNLVHVAHNVVIGKNTAVIANALIGGSTVIGDNCWIAPSVTLRDGIKIGDNSVVGIGSLVLKDIPSNETWVGSPAKKFK
jgi:UDP-3-O-[3-hydroxymyristoyl] glucosamine N-acyltransferase